MSELKVYRDPKEGPCWREFYEKTEADKVIAEKDAEISDLEQKLHDIDNQWNEQCKEIAELKAKLESVQATAYADSVDAGMRERRLRRALYIARAERAIEKIACFKLWNGSISTMNPEDGARQEFDKWKKNLGKFLSKAEVYK